VLYGSQWGRATIHNTGVGPLHINNLTASGLSIRGITLPATVAPGATLSWSVGCIPTSGTKPIRSSMIAWHDGAPPGIHSLFSITCYHYIIVVDPPGPPTSPSAAAGASSR